MIVDVEILDGAIWVKGAAAAQLDVDATRELARQLVKAADTLADRQRAARIAAMGAGGWTINNISIGNAMVPSETAAARETRLAREADDAKYHRALTSRTIMHGPGNRSYIHRCACGDVVQPDGMSGEEAYARHIGVDVAIVLGVLAAYDAARDVRDYGKDPHDYDRVMRNLAAASIHLCDVTLSKTASPTVRYAAVSLFESLTIGGAHYRGWAEPGPSKGVPPSVLLRANGESSWMSPNDARSLAAMLNAAALGVNAFGPDGGH